MSLLPQYQKDIHNHEESVPLWSADENDDSSRKHIDEESLPGYPPQPHQSTINTSAGESGTLIHNISYIYVENGNDKDEALSVLGKTKEETIAIAKRGFTELSSIPSDRIELLYPIERESDTGLSKRTKWVKILDEAWPQFQHQPPKSIKVKVTELPGEKAKRERREVACCGFICLVLFSIVVGLIVLSITSGKNKNKHDGN